LRQCVAKTLPRLEANKKKIKILDAQNILNGPEASVQAEGGFEGWSKRLGESREGPSCSPGHPGDTFLTAAWVSSGQGMWNSVFSGFPAHKRLEKQPLRCCQKGWCYSRGCSAIFGAPGELFTVKITHN